MKIKLVLLLFAAGCIAIIITSCQSEGEQMYNRYYTTGTLLYRSHCENCHGVNGEGLNDLIPSFHDSVYLRKNLGNLPCFIKYGLKAQITVGNKTFTGQQMPAQGNLTSIEIAEVLTYVTNSFGNKIGLIDAPKVNNDLAKCDGE